MSEWSRIGPRWLLALSCAVLLGSGFPDPAQASPVFSFMVSRPFLGPPTADPGPYVPNGFATNAGTYSAATSSSYFDGTGWQTVPGGDFRAFLIGYDQSGRGQWFPVAPLSGDTATWAMTLNSQGHLVGNSMPSSQNSWLNIWHDSPGTDHAIFYSLPWGTIPLQTLNGTSGLPMGINNLDQIVGESYTSKGTIHGFITVPGGAAFDLNSLIQQGSGYTILAGTSINDQGQIATIAQGPDGKDYFLILTPNVPLSTILGTANDSPPPSSSSNPPPVSPPAVPEPAPIWLLGLVSAWATVMRFRSRPRL